MSELRCAYCGKSENDVIGFRTRMGYYFAFCLDCIRTGKTEKNPLNELGEKE